jgi:hypothetical protein
MMKLIPTAVATKFGRQLLHVQKQSPQLMFGAGIATGLASTVMACRATLKLSDVLDKGQELKDKAEAIYDDGKNPEYPEKTYAKDLTVIKVRTIMNVSKLYAPAAGLAMISVGLLTGSHVTLNRRNASLTAAYASVDQAFQNYRLRVKEQFGEETDRDLRYGTRVDEETAETADGKKKIVKHTRVGDENPSQYARFFDELCPEWKRNPEYNKIFLQAQQSYFNNMLNARGHVFLNEVYDALGLPRSKAGAVVGWLQNAKGDGYVDFGIFDNIANPNVKDFVNGREYSILLDFNVDGVIYDKI